MIVIVAASTAVFAVGGVLLFLAFRAFGTAKRGDIKHVVLLVSAILFILASCVALLIWSVVSR